MDKQGEKELPAFKRKLYLASGIFLSGLGIVGIFTPLLPTTCFVLGAAWFFARSSPGLSAWLEKNRLLGPYLESWTRKKRLPMSHLVGSMLVLWAGMLLSITFLGLPLWVDLLLLAIGLGVSLHIVYLALVRRNLQPGPASPETQTAAESDC